MAKTTGDEELEKIYKELSNIKESSGSKRNSYSSESSSDEGNSLLRFFMGLLMLGGGLFMILNNLVISSSWGRGGYLFRLGSWDVPNGMVMFPIVAGIAMLFLMDRKIFGWIVVSIGVVIVLLSVMLTTHIVWRTTSAYVFIIMFGLTAAGGGLVIRELFKKK